MAMLHTITIKLAAVFVVVLVLACAIGAVALNGLTQVTTHVGNVVERNLPTVQTSADLVDIATRLQTDILLYLNQPFADEGSEKSIRELLSEFEMLAKGGPTTPQDMEVLRHEVEEGFKAHRDAAVFHFEFEGKTFQIIDFLNRVSVETAAYLKQTNAATRFGVFDGVMTDPSQSLFHRWRAQAHSFDADFTALLDAYAKQEVDMIGYVAERVVSNPETAQSQFIRMQSRRLPRLERAFNALMLEAESRTSALSSEKARRQASVTKVLFDVTETARATQSDAMSQMNNAIGEAQGNARRTTELAILTATGAIVLSILISVLATITIGRPLGRLTGIIRRLSEREFDLDIPFRKRRDEIGALARAADVFRDNGIKQMKLEKEKNRELAEKAEIERSAREAAEAERRSAIANGEEASAEAMRQADEARRLSALQKQAEIEKARQEREQTEILSKLADALGKLSNGALNITIPDELSGDYEQLRCDFNSAASGLLEAMVDIVQNAGDIEAQTTELSSSNADLARRTETQAATLNQTSEALGQLTRSVQAVSEGAQVVDEVVENAQNDAEKSGHVVQDAIQAMEEIKKTSGEITKITSVINEIAFQTNLLALNAGVEAARAGEAGRGFAVVASEVRALAQRSAEASQDINTLIANSERQINDGAELVSQAGNTLSGLVGSVEEVSEHLKTITASTREQSAGLTEINLAINELDSVTQQNAAMFEETAAASQALQGQAENLFRTVGRFDVEQREASATDLSQISA
jgi:methyl-accepting chemotaxis protein